MDAAIRQLPSGICSRYIAQVLNLEPSEIDSRFQPRSFYRRPVYYRFLENQSAPKQIKVNKDKYFELVSTTKQKSILVFCPETYNPANDLSVRVCRLSGSAGRPSYWECNGCLAGFGSVFLFW